MNVKWYIWAIIISYLSFYRKGYTGEKCECNLEGDANTASDLDKYCYPNSNNTVTSGKMCDGHGECRCGQCKCDDKHLGQYCQCKKSQCPQGDDGEYLVSTIKDIISLNQFSVCFRKDMQW